MLSPSYGIHSVGTPKKNLINLPIIEKERGIRRTEFLKYRNLYDKPCKLFVGSFLFHLFPHVHSHRIMHKQRIVVLILRKFSSSHCSVWILMSVCEIFFHICSNFSLCDCRNFFIMYHDQTNSELVIDNMLVSERKFFLSVIKYQVRQIGHATFLFSFKLM